MATTSQQDLGARILAGLDDPDRLAEAFGFIVNALSGRERRRWARAGYPGLRRKDPSGPAGFLAPGRLRRRLGLAG